MIMPLGPVDPISNDDTQLRISKQTSCIPNDTDWLTMPTEWYTISTKLKMLSPASKRHMR